MSLEIASLRLQPHHPGASELSQHIVLSHATGIQMCIVTQTLKVGFTSWTLLQTLIELNHHWEQGIDKYSPSI